MPHQKALDDEIINLRQKVQNLTEHLNIVVRAEAHYRETYVMWGAGATHTGTAWDLLSTAGNAARGYLGIRTQATTGSKLPECPWSQLEKLKEEMAECHGLLRSPSFDNDGGPTYLPDDIASLLSILKDLVDNPVDPKKKQDEGTCYVHKDETHCACWWDGKPCCACGWNGGHVDGEDDGS